MSKLYTKKIFFISFALMLFSCTAPALESKDTPAQHSRSDSTRVDSAPAETACRPLSLMLRAVDDLEHNIPLIQSWVRGFAPALRQRIRKQRLDSSTDPSSLQLMITLYRSERSIEDAALKHCKEQLAAYERVLLNIFGKMNGYPVLVTASNLRIHQERGGQLVLSVQETSTLCD